MNPPGNRSTDRSQRSRAIARHEAIVLSELNSLLLVLAIGVLVATPAWGLPASRVEVNAQAVSLRLLSVFGLIAINAFFVTAEFSMVSVRRSRIDQLVDSGDVPAKTVQALQRDIDRLLSTTQLGITLSSLALGWIGERTMAVFVASGLMALPLSDPTRTFLTHTFAIPLAFVLVAYLQIVLGELCPKSVALLYAEQLARLLGPPSLAIARLFNPFLWVLNQSTRWLLRLVGIRNVDRSWSNRVTPEELQRIIALEGESTGLEAEERELLTNIFEFGDVCAEEVMVPRTQITALPSDATFSQLLQEVARSGHSRYPVIGESLDDVRGIVHFKELAEPLARGQIALETPIRPWVRPVRFVPEYTPLSELLPLLQRSTQPIVMVVDEFGGTAGLIAIQDLVAEIIGESAEDEDNDDVSVKMLDDRTFIVQAQLHLEEVNELLNLELPIVDDYQTLGGFLIYQMQKIPQIGESMNFDNLELKVISAEGPRLHQIQIQRRDATPPLQTETSADPPTSSHTLDLDTALPTTDLEIPLEEVPPPERDSLFGGASEEEGG
ncbi:Magnesium and cobalt efflux protein CorC [Geitlerinema sp. FC II]|nr:hemolysin family protein [Geitlerinema sp. CS-897]PPT10775.1 Magnesium and cobalt efflux protein CorC [Geitlerinema sp. FC II]